MEPSTSLFERWIARPRRPWVRPGIYLLFVGMPFVAVALDGDLANIFAQGLWRAWLPAAIIVYIVAVSSPLSAMESRAIRSLRSVLLLADEGFDRVLRDASVIRPIYEALIVGAGLVVGLVAENWRAGGPGSWHGWVSQVSVPLMYAMLAWVVYAGFAETRLTSALLRQPLRVDPLDTAPFEPVGRRSLAVALAFIGGSTLSLVFVGTQPGGLRDPAAWVTYGTLALATVAIFFLSMRPTHDVLAVAKKAELSAVRAQIAAICRAHSQSLHQNQPTGTVASDLNVLIIYEGRLKESRTWPYNTPMLRALALSVLVPLVPVAGRLIIEALWP